MIFQDLKVKYFKGKIKRSVKCATSVAKGKTPFKNGEEKIMRAAPSKLTSANYRDFIWKETTSLKDLINPLFSSDEALHSTRKLLKDILFVWPFIKSEAAVILPSAILCSKDDLRFISKRLGKFQDACSRLKLLQVTDANGIKDEKETLFLKTLEKNWSKEKDTLRNEIQQLFLKRIPARPTFALLPDGNHSGIKNKLLTR